MRTIRWLAEDAQLRLRILEPGAEGAVDAEVRWVHNTELPDPSMYVRDQELVLTNGLWLTDADSAQEFVAPVVRAGAVGVVFGLREHVRTTPQVLRDACREAGLPLLELAVETPFTALSHAMAAAYAEERQHELVGRVRRGDALAAAIVQGSGAEGVLDVLRRDRELPLAVLDRAGRVLATVGVELTPEEVRLVTEALWRHPPPLEVELPALGRASLFLIAALGEVDAGLICQRSMAELSQGDQDALGQAAAFLSLEVSKRQAVQAIEMRFAGELLDIILSGSSREYELPGRLRAFGVEVSDPLAVCALAFAGDTATDLSRVSEVAVDFLVSKGVPAVVAPGSQDVVVVASWRRSERELTELATALTAEASRRCGGQRVVAGLGRIAADGFALRQPLLESREACRALRHREGQPVATFNELNTHLLFLSTQDPHTLRRFSAGLLEPLRAHDAERGSDLEATLRTFLDLDGHWAATAQALHIHVNTLRNRIGRITELTGLDVNRTADRVDLFLALRADAMAQML